MQWTRNGLLYLEVILLVSGKPQCTDAMPTYCTHVVHVLNNSCTSINITAMLGYPNLLHKLSTHAVHVLNTLFTQ